MNKLIHGNYTWSTDDDSLQDASLFLSNSIAGEELTIDTLDVTVDCSVESGNGKILSVDPRTFAYGSVLEYYHNTQRLGKFYFAYAKRVGKYVFTLHGVSAVGLLDKLPHAGGIYTGQTAATLLANLFSGVTAYTVASDVAELSVYGWLPYATRRENLHQLLFALGAALLKNASGNPHVAFLTDGTGTPISNERIFSGGEVSYNTLATGVMVTEHTYVALSSGETATLFDNTDGSGSVTNETVVFDGPHHSLSATSGLRIISSGVNYAVLTGLGTLTGKKYTHQTKLISEQSTEATGEDNVVTVEDATLVSVANSRNVAKRELSYYSSRRTVTMDILSMGERPGDMLSFSNPFDETNKGLLQSLEFPMAQILRASATIITDYTPKWYGNKYNAYTVISKNGTYTIPSGVEEVLVLLIGGGEGGWSGQAGQEANINTAPTVNEYHEVTDNTTLYTGYGVVKGGAGGEAGLGGLGGKVHRTELAVTPGQTFTITVGVGGNGGAFSATGSVRGSPGGASKFGTLTSANGMVMEAGYMDVITGKLYATAGVQGVPGGAGSGGMDEPDGEADKLVIVDGPPVTGPDGTIYTVAPAPTGRVESEHASVNNGGVFAAMAYGLAQAGASGGAAVGSNGGVGSDGAAYSGRSTSSVTVSAGATGGQGGKGGNAVAPAKVSGTYGQGGTGGHGGGGAGGGGYAYCVKRLSKKVSATANVRSTRGPSGVPGNGSNGGPGGDGCVVVFYRKK